MSTFVVRAGQFRCRAQAIGLGATGSDPANPADTPCVDAEVAQTWSQSAGDVTVTVRMPRAYTDQTPDRLGTSPPTPGDGALSAASIAEVTIRSGPQTIRLRGVTASAEAVCTPGGGSLLPRLASTSAIAAAQIDEGPEQRVAEDPLEIPIAGLATLHLNHESFDLGIVTRRAVWLELPGDDLILAEASAGLTADPCST